MITAGEFRNGRTFEHEGNVFQIVEFQHVKPGKGAAFVRTKLKNIISYKISKRPILKQVLDMVEDATRKIKETKGIILHSDQGWQYQNS